MSKSSVDLKQGRIEYRDEGEGRPLVFVHGLLVDSGIWDETIPPLLEAGLRCLRPELPMGSHTVPLSPGTDLSPPGVASLLGDFLDALDLEDAILVGNDSGGAICQMLCGRGQPRIGRLVLTNCDIGEVFPPFPYSLMPPIARLPGGIQLLAQPMRLGPLRRLAYRELAAVSIPDARTRAWTRPGLSDGAIREDARKLIAGADKSQTIEAAERLRTRELPILFAWGRDDRFFKLSMAERFASTLIDARVEPIERARTYVMLDRPDRLAELIAAFAGQDVSTRKPRGR